MMLPAEPFAILDICIDLDFLFIQDAFCLQNRLQFWTFAIIQIFITLGDFCHLQHLQLFSSILILKAFALLDISHYSDFY